jgi:hypothetical protein
MQDLHNKAHNSCYSNHNDQYLHAGQFLHAAADVHSHSGYASLFGHLTGGHAPDKTYNAVSEAMVMAVAIHHRLVELVDHCWPQFAKEAVFKRLSAQLTDFFSIEEDGISEKKLKKLVDSRAPEYMTYWRSYQEWRDKTY